MKFRRIIFGVAALSIFVSCDKKQEQKEVKLPEYPTTVISKQNATLESTFPVNIKGQEDIEIRPRIDGFIKEIYVDEGSMVKKGSKLFSIDSPQAEQGIRTASAAVTSAQAQVETAKLDVDRIKPLADQGIVSEVQLQTRQNAYESSKAMLAQAEAGLRNARSVIQWTTVTSPVDGIVGDIPFRLGSLVNSSNVLTTVANTKEVYAYFSLNEKSLVDLLAGLEGTSQKEKIENLPQVLLKLRDGSLYSEKGKIKTIAGQLNSTTGSVMLRADFPNSLGILRSGFSGSVIIPVEMDGVVVVPQRATYSQQDKRLLYKVEGDSVVSTLISVIPTPDGHNYVVTEGLNEGDKIVADGIATLRNGMKISAK